ncbi:MAG: FMN-dependent NADH-azoreductase [Planctomycetes bacterium RBG_13_63_9]|nr:MAG: FMN-dependent NADH-azoreductase [Planctomycetes bacterium RBG_13_63_9]
MERVLHIAASPRGEHSKSLQVARAFLEEYVKRAPSDEITRLDVFTMKLPAFDGPALQAKYNILHGKENSRAEGEAWVQVEAVIEDFKAADKYVLSLPMWNFGIPYPLKHYFDVLVQPGYTFSFDPERGYSGLVTGRPVVAIYARGGEYAATEAIRLDMQKPYIETILGFMGLTDIRSIVVEPTLAAGPDRAAQRVQQAIAEAEELARSF